MALMAGVPIIPGFIVRLNGARQHIVIEEPIYPGRAGDRTEAALRLTEVYTARIEGYIRRYPGHWLWAHRRWKTRQA
jgi:KDO2-lipid IV(A) lauroyltransferase